MNWKDEYKKALDSIDLPPIETQSGEAIEFDREEAAKAIHLKVFEIIQDVIANHSKTLK